MDLKLEQKKKSSFQIQKPSQEVLIAKAVISLKAFAVEKEGWCPGSERKQRQGVQVRWCIKVDHPAGGEGVCLSAAVRVIW